MNYTYVINDFNPDNFFFNVTYSNNDPELEPITLDLHLPNATTPELLETLISEYAPVRQWGQMVVAKNLQIVVGDSRTANRDLLRPISEININPVSL